MRFAPLVVAAGLPFALGGGPSPRIARNEARTIELLLSLVGAEADFASSNSGLYDELHSLPSRHGYRFRFHPGPAAGSAAVPGQSSPSSLLRYAITAVPIQEGVTGSRWFCADQDGVIREPDGRRLTAEGGGCLRGTRTAKAPPPSSPEEGESLTIADLRVLASAQQAYAAQNCAFFDRLDCLAEPWRCLPSVREDGPIFLDPQVASLTERHGYRRRFYPGARPSVDPRAGCSPTSMLSYAYTAVPALPGRSGRRAFCADSTGALCQAPAGKPGVIDARCEPCTPLEWIRAGVPSFFTARSGPRRRT